MALAFSLVAQTDLQVPAENIVRTAHLKVSLWKIAMTADLNNPNQQEICSLEGEIPVYSPGNGDVIVIPTDFKSCEATITEKKDGQPKKVLIKAEGRLLIRDKKDNSALKYFLGDIIIMDETGNKLVREPAIVSAATKLDTDYLLLEGSSLPRRKGGDLISMGFEFSDPKTN
jgi:hypothetical protein